MVHGVACRDKKMVQLKRRATMNTREADRGGGTHRTDVVASLLLNALDTEEGSVSLQGGFGDGPLRCTRALREIVPTHAPKKMVDYGGGEEWGWGAAHDLFSDRDCEAGCHKNPQGNPLWPPSRERAHGGRGGGNG